jgi:hypothetical protein
MYVEEDFIWLLGDRDMTDASNEASFTFSWLALKLLGRGLYSNPWSALSELVANGLDAGARNVYVYVDARDKSSAIVEVIDDGSGMDESGIATYVMVGYNKRADPSLNGTDDPESLKGRKGIGKLAALFLSQHFYLRTRHERNESEWELDAGEGKVADDDRPKLLVPQTIPATANDALWQELATGTRITLLDVDLTGYGPQSISALGSRLANQFLLPTSTGPRILMWVRTSESDEPNYAPTQKTIAFGNFAEVSYNFRDAATQPPELATPPERVMIPAKGLEGDIFEYQPRYVPFAPTPPEDEAWRQIEEQVDRAKKTFNGVKYDLTGWIGLHASIDGKIARQNDERFNKNRYYNPAQLRVYVRGKLASDHLLSQLGITGTYINYIEGEISFDLLDDDRLPDIATSNRQDFDETDGRVTLLRVLVRPIVRQLIQRRMEIAASIKAKQDEEKSRRDATGKRHFSNQLRDDLAQHPEISESVRDELQMVITNKVQGDVELKSEFRVFLSHASADYSIASFLDELLQARGAMPEEIFFTSRLGSVAPSLSDHALSAVIKESLVNANTLIFYLTSKNFLESEYCLFEGGAGWATRSVSEYLKLNVDYDSIPKFLTNGKAEVMLLAGDKKIVLRPDVHNYLVSGVLNPMIAHLNRGRDIAGTPAIELFDLASPPPAIELKKNGQVYSDYYDPTIAEHWEILVDSEMESYLSEYLAHP